MVETGEVEVVVVGESGSGGRLAAEAGGRAGLPVVLALLIRSSRDGRGCSRLTRRPSIYHMRDEYVYDRGYSLGGIPLKSTAELSLV